MEANLWQLFVAVSASCAERESIVWRQTRLTYADLERRARRIGSALASRVGRPTRERAELHQWESGQPLVATYLYNCPEYLEVSLGCYAARLAPFNVNYRYVEDELAYLLNDAGAAAVVYHGAFAPTMVDVLPRLKKRPVLIQVDDGSGQPLLDGAIDYEQAIEGADDDVGHDQSPDDLYVLYTGGTTGMPKGTLWRQADVWVGALGGAGFGDFHSTDDYATALAAQPQTTVFPLPPLMHGAAHWVAIRSLCSGGRLLLASVTDRLDPDDVWSLVEREAPDWLTLVGEAFARPLLDGLERRPRDVSSLKVLANGGAPLLSETKQRYLDRIPGLVVMDGAGASESGTTLTQLSTGSAGSPSVFQPSPTTTVLDAERTRRLAPGEDQVGWVATSGPIPLGYLGDEAKTRQTFVDVDGERWSIPGDRARLQDDGLIELLGRDSVTINSGGEKIFAEEVERAILQTPGVRDAVVVGRPSERWGSEVVAVIEADDTVMDEEISRQAGASLARYKLPKLYVRVECVVRSPAGKADYEWARRLAANGTVTSS